MKNKKGIFTWVEVILFCMLLTMVIFLFVAVLKTRNEVDNREQFCIFMDYEGAEHHSSGFLADWNYYCYKLENGIEIRKEFVKREEKYYFIE